MSVAACTDDVFRVVDDHDDVDPSPQRAREEVEHVIPLETGSVSGISDLPKLALVSEELPPASPTPVSHKLAGSLAVEAEPETKQDTHTVLNGAPLEAAAVSGTPRTTESPRVFGSEDPSSFPLSTRQPPPLPPPNSEPPSSLLPPSSEETVCSSGAHDVEKTAQQKTLNKPDGFPQEAMGGTSGPDLARAALQPGSNVDFRQITEICARLEAVPSEVSSVVEILSTALRDRERPLRQILQALTIAHELMYSKEATHAFRREPGLSEALGVLREVRDSSLGAPFDENIRMLATEVDRACFDHLPERRRSSVSSGGVFGGFGKTGFNFQATADKITEKTSTALQKAGKKAGKTFDRVASSVRQEAERTWTSMATTGVGEASANLMSTQAAPGTAGTARLLPFTPPDRVAQGSHAASLATEHELHRKRQFMETSVLEEEQQLQWALNMSMAPPVSPPTSSSVSADTKSILGEGAVSANPRQRLEHAEAQIQRIAATVDDTAMRAIDISTECSDFRARLRESMNLAKRLQARLREAESQLLAEKRRHSVLEASLSAAAAASPSEAATAAFEERPENAPSSAASMDRPVVVSVPSAAAADSIVSEVSENEHVTKERQLRARVAELEALVAAANGGTGCPSAGLDAQPSSPL
eukprot:TRINITY_DN33444_c0_g1_i1.p1 TRINITY_DN33444_c0_g1~~TRINITY_DN33444_c0_g1_i1.p1  ORF type:complete len:677 (+),score=119.03 TRINITY_DN33444_c0_g1_i1:91-2031(+)